MKKNKQKSLQGFKVHSTKTRVGLDGCTAKVSEGRTEMLEGPGGLPLRNLHAGSRPTTWTFLCSGVGELNDFKNGSNEKSINVK